MAFVRQRFDRTASGAEEQEIFWAAREDFVVVVELAAEPGDAHQLSNREPGQIDIGLDVDEDHELARTVVDRQLEAVREIVLGPLGDGADGGDEQPFGRLADFASGHGFRLHPAPGAVEPDVRGTCGHEDQQTEAVRQPPSDTRLAARRDT